MLCKMYQKGKVQDSPWPEKSFDAVGEELEVHMIQSSIL